MELRQYWQIVRRRLWIVIVLLIVVVASVVIQPKAALTYQASMRFMLGLEPEAKIGNYYSYDSYYTWLTAEYLVDDVSELVRSAAFAQAVSARLGSMGITIPVGAIYGSTQAGRLHRILTVSVVWGDAKQLMEIANAMAVVLPTEIARHLAQVGTGGVYASLIDPPAATVVAPSLRQRMDLPIRLLLGLVAGIAFVFLLDYLDDSVRTSQEVEDSGIRVLGEVSAFSGRSRHGLSRVTGPGWFRQRLP